MAQWGLLRIKIVNSYILSQYKEFHVRTCACVPDEGILRFLNVPISRIRKFLNLRTAHKRVTGLL